MERNEFDEKECGTYSVTQATGAHGFVDEAGLGAGALDHVDVRRAPIADSAVQHEGSDGGHAHATVVLLAGLRAVVVVERPLGRERGRVVRRHARRLLQVERVRESQWRVFVNGFERRRLEVAGVEGVAEEGLGRALVEGVASRVECGGNGV